MSDQHSEAATEDDNLASRPASSSAGDVENTLVSPPRPEDSSDPAALPLSAFYPLFMLAAGAVLSLIATLALIFNAQNGYEVDYFHLSSFNVFKNSSLTTWDAKLSLNRSRLGFFDDRNVAYEARLWLYSRNGFVSVSSPSMSPGRGGGGGGELILRSNFMMKEAEEEDVVRDGILIIDLLIEANATRASGRPPAALYVMIECSDLEIEFAGNRSYGELSGGGAKRCGAEVYATKSDALESGRILDLLRRLFYYLAFRIDRGMSRVY